MKYIDEILGFNGQVAIICSIIAAIICLIFIPQDIRQKIIFMLHKHRRTLKFVIRGKLDKNRNFIILSSKQNDKIMKRYFELKYDRIYIKILDFRKYKIIKNVLQNNKLRKQNVIRMTLRKIDLQHQTIVKAIDCLLIDKSAIYEIYRKKYSYNKLITSIMDYVINEHNESPTFEVKFAYYKTKNNGLPSDVELKLHFDIFFLKKYCEKIDKLYFDIAKMDQYATIYNLKDMDDDLLYKAIKFCKRNNMDIYDLEIEDYIKYVVPRFYVFVSNICDGEWVYSKLDKKQYRIDHFEFDLETLYRLCKEHKLIS
ncbi:hypothetical protein [uncultured Thomasclavelia sp.]|uniref:hypothetical protein n=1 Tax=uncultured Thomasclavelia sp. TaxID=3025759 RepID=UPI00280AF938|nr:hypothetical protein [uncultured Thomasclavelia sp.]